MARPSGTDYQPVDDPAQPSLADARLAAINQTVAPDTTLEPEHPAITFAKNLLSPMGPYGQSLTSDADTTPAPPQPFYQKPNPGLDLTGIGRNLAYGIADAAGSGELPNSVPLFGALSRATNPSKNTVTSALGQVEQARRTAGEFLSGGHYEGDTLVPGDIPLPGYGAAGALAEGVVAPAARAVASKALGAAEDLARPAQRAFALEPEAASPRYTVETGKTRSLIRDTTTGETTPTIYGGADHAARAQAAADELNSGAQAAKTMAAPEAQMSAALDNLTKVKTPDGNLGRTVRIAARELGLTEEQMLASPEMQGQIMQALAKSKLPASDENVVTLAQRILEQEKARPTVGNQNYSKVMDALGANDQPISFGEDIPKPVNVPASAEQTAANAGAQTAAQQAQNDMLQQAIAKRQGAMPGGQMPPDLALPIGPPKATAGGLAMEALRLVTDIPRSLMVIGHLPILRQGLPLMADALVRGNPKEIPLALGRSLQAAVASPLRAQAITQGFRDTLEGAGLKVGRDGVAITDPVGAMAAREEFGLHSVLSKVPVISNLNRIYPTMLNSLRTGAAVDLAKLYEQSGRSIDSARIGHFVNIASGRGDIPAILDTPVGREILSGVFFGPRLTTSSWQMAADTIGSLRGVAGDVLSRRALDPVEVAQVRTTAAYVATGVGIMKLANSFGMNIGVDPTKTDFGRITLPDGKRLDLWGPFNENARLIAREIEFIHGAVQGKPGYNATTGADLAVNYLRSKLNAGAPTAAGDVMFGSTQGGESLQQAYGTPEALRKKLLPLPFAGQEATAGSSMGPGMNALETGLVAAGATVIDQPAKVTYDGLGKPDTNPNHGNDPILQEHDRLMGLDPNFAKTPLQPPSTTIGSGRNSFKLPATEDAKYIQAVGEQRRVDLGALIYSSAYQNATVAQQEKMFKDTQAEADRKATRAYLANDVITATDPKAIVAEAVTGFHSQSNAHDQAYWIGLLERAGKLTSDVVQAIDDSNVSKPGQKAPITVEEYRKAAPLVHEYLAHVPYGTDAHPIGTPADWSAVAQAHIDKNNRVDELTRSGINPTLADARAQAEILRAMTSVVQRNLFLNGAQLENPQRRLIATKYPTLKRFLGSNAGSSQESESEYRNFGQ